MKLSLLKKHFALILVLSIIIGLFNPFFAVAESTNVISELAEQNIFELYKVYTRGGQIEKSRMTDNSHPYHAYVLAKTGETVTNWVYEGISFEDKLLGKMDETINDSSLDKKDVLYVADLYLAAFEMEYQEKDALLSIIKEWHLDGVFLDGAYEQFSNVSVYDVLVKTGAIEELDVNEIIDYILSLQQDNGNFSGDMYFSDLMITTEAVRVLKSLAEITEYGKANVDTAIAEAIKWIQGLIKEDGSFIVSDWDEPITNTAEVIKTLNALGYDLNEWKHPDTNKGPADYMLSRSDYSNQNVRTNVWALEAYHLLGAQSQNNEKTPNPGDGSENQTPTEVSIYVVITGKYGQLFSGYVDLSTSDLYGKTPLGALHKTGLSYDYDTISFIHTIAGEKNEGLSGWMYRVNGTAPTKSANNYILSDGDQLEWFYSTDQTSLAGELGLEPTRDENVKYELPHVIQKSANWLLQQNDFDLYDTFSDWDVLALSRSRNEVPDRYKTILISHVHQHSGVLRNVTDYARIILALRSIGEDASNVGGYDLYQLMLEHEGMLDQGINGPAYALIALESSEYDNDMLMTWNRKSLLDLILDQQNYDGSYSLSINKTVAGDIDITAIVLQSLAPFKDQREVRRVVEKALSWLETQTPTNCESLAQMIIALTMLEEDILDSRFSVNNITLLDQLMQYQNDDGGFGHELGENSDHIATQQALMALTAYHRFVEDEPTFFDMQDVTLNNTPLENDQLEDSLEERLKQVKLTDENQVSTWALEWVKKAVAYGLMSGVSQEELRFDPLRELTRAEFTALMTKTLEADLLTSSNVNYRDVQPGSWYYEHVMSASERGWVSGVGSNEFAPQKTITRQEMAVVLKKALQLELLEDELSKKPVDIHIAAPWATTGVEAVYQQRLMVGDGQRFMPVDTVTREMAAVIMVKLYEAQLQE